ncbi:hypothetical protein Srufu_079130 (plasmid) [Streptomyces libani subsp. rufus]|nr:hypothetical protein Srufu_079130 [Streptomyces libani subsp. rufus]
MGNADTSTTAAAHLRTLREVSSGTKRRGDIIGPSRGSKPVHAPAPIDIDLVDHLIATRSEVIEAVRRYNPNASAAPVDEGIYQWMEDSSEELDDGRRRALEAIAYRQSLEHALRAGNRKALRWPACPGCNCFGLSWNAPLQKAACLNQRCLTEEGLQSTWDLRQVAQHHIATQGLLRRTAT